MPVEALGDRGDPNRRPPPTDFPRIGPDTSRESVPLTARDAQSAPRLRTYSTARSYRLLPEGDKNDI